MGYAAAVRDDIQQIAERVRRAHKIPDPTDKSPQIAPTARALGISRNEWKEILDGKVDVKPAVLKKIQNADREARIKKNGKRELTADRKRRMMIGVLEAMSDAAIDDNFHFVMQAGAADLSEIFGEDPGPRGGGTGGFDVNL